MKVGGGRLEKRVFQWDVACIVNSLLLIHKSDVYEINFASTPYRLCKGQKATKTKLRIKIKTGGIDSLEILCTTACKLRAM